jgi:hypothetical protein
MRALTAAVILSLLLGAGFGCPGGNNGPTPPDTGVDKIEVKGRVVDFESCITSSGCLGVSGVQVALFSDTSIFSAKTPPSGTFSIRNVPAQGASEVYLYVTDASGVYLSALQATPVPMKGADVFGLELFGLKRQGALWSGIVKEAKVDVQTHALYLGQIFRVEQGKMKAIPDVAIQSIPASTVRFVNCISSFTQCKGQPTLFTNRTTTGQFGQFMLIAKGPGTVAHTIYGNALNYTLAPLRVPLGVGYVAIGSHEASLGGSDAGPTQPDAAAPKEGGP